MTDSVKLDNTQVDEDEAEERRHKRFELLREILADKRMTSAAALKVIFHLVLFRYNDRSGRCDPGVPDIAKYTALTERTVRKALELLRDVVGYLVYTSSKGGNRRDTNEYSFQSQPLSKSTGVKPTP